jgi:regulator of replication initiation timing
VAKYEGEEMSKQKEMLDEIGKLVTETTELRIENHRLRRDNWGLRNTTVEEEVNRRLALASAERQRTLEDLSKKS